MKKQLVKAVAVSLKSYGYTVYLSKNEEYGFYTDGIRVVCFGGSWNFCLDFTGNYWPSRESGTGWAIAKEQGVPTRGQAAEWIKANAPSWANRNPSYTTPEQHLKTYGASSGYWEFTGEE